MEGMRYFNSNYVTMTEELENLWLAKKKELEAAGMTFRNRPMDKGDCELGWHEHGWEACAPMRARIAGKSCRAVLAWDSATSDIGLVVYPKPTGPSFFLWRMQAGVVKEELNILDLVLEKL
jgi:hypothetical protein